MMKKSISILLIFTFLISVFSVGTVFAYESETVFSDAYSENVLFENYTNFADVAGCNMVKDGNAMTFTVNKGTDTGTKNRQYGSTIDGMSWQNTGRVELTYTVSYSGTLANGDAFGMGIGLTSFNGTSRAWILGGVASFTNFKFEDGAVKNKKSIIDFTDTQIIVTNFVKNPEDEEWTQTEVVTNNFAAAPNKRHIREILPFIQYNYNYGTVDTEVSATISDITLKELFVEPIMDDVTGNYLGYDSIETNYYIPEGYKSAELTFNGEVLKSFNPEEDAYGCYNTFFGLYQFGYSGQNIPLKLSVTDANDNVKECVSYITVTEPIEEPSYESVAGSYTTANTLNLNFEIPHIYESASLFYNGEVISSYEPGANSGGPYTFPLVLGDYDVIGKDIPIEFRVTYADREDDVFTDLIDVKESYLKAEFEDVSGMYINTDTIYTHFVLPDDYNSAQLTFNGKVLEEYNIAENESGRYSMDIVLADYGINGEDIPLTLTVDSASKGEEKFTSSIDIPVVTEKEVLVNEDFEDDTFEIYYDADPALTIQKVDSTTFDSRVFYHEFKDTKFARSQLIKRDLKIKAGQCVDFEWDVWVSTEKFLGGLHGKMDSGTWYSAQRFQKDGMLGNKAFPIGKWHRVLYRLFPGSTTENGKPEFHFYIDGVYCGKTESAYNSGIQQIAIDYDSNYTMGQMYIDNINISVYAPMYSASVSSASGDAEIDAANPAMNIKFNQAMSSNSINPGSMSLVGFNGAEIYFDYSYDTASNTLSVVPAEKLVPGKAYTFKFTSDVTTEFGAHFEEGYDVTFNTKDIAFRVEEAVVPTISAGKEFDVDVTVVNENGDEKAAKLFSALFVDGKLESIASVDASGTYTSDEFTLTLKAPAKLGEEVKVCTYLVNGVNSFEIIDWVE